MNKRLSRKFYTRPTLTVAKDLLGKYLIVSNGSNKFVGKIVEVEAYMGEKDKASHAYGGKKTPKRKLMYSEGGFVYIYLCYGMYWQLNFVTEQKDVPQCVLVRALEPVLPESDLKEIKNLANGPGKLCRWMNLDKSFNEEDLAKSDKIWLEDRGEEIKKSQIVACERIGIDYAKEWAKKPLRFYIKDNICVSRF